MKTKKLNLENLKDVLSRDEMRQIMAGSGSGSCQTYGEECDSGSDLNCCNNLVCATYKCQFPTLSE